MVEGIAGSAASDRLPAQDSTGVREQSRIARLAAPLPPAFGGVAVAALGVSQGGYFPTAWGWASLIFLWVAAVSGVTRSSLRLNVWLLGLLASYGLLAAWIAASAFWSPSLTASLPELARAGVYVTAVLAVVTIVERSNYVSFLAGVLAGITTVCSYSLSTRLFPDRLAVFDPFAIYRVSEPLGYWNALGVFAVLGIVLALGFAIESQTAAARAVAAASLAITLPTLYFTFGRGGWIALFAALGALVAFSPRRLWAIGSSSIVLMPAVVAVVVASESEALTRRDAVLAEAVDEGRRLAVIVVLAAAAAAVLAILLARAQVTIRLPRGTTTAIGVAIVAVVLLAGAAGVAAAGGPASVVDRAADEFREPPPRPVDLNDRLRNLSGNGRADLWSIAWRQHRDHPWFGRGAGTYEQYHSARREPGMPKVRDAHGLYVEILGELGRVGLALLVLALALPLFAGLLARRSPLVPAAAAAYVAYLVHAAADWDWEMPAVTVGAIFCGAAMTVAAGRTVGTLVGGRGRTAIVAAAVVLALPTAYFLLGEAALSEAAAARRTGDVAKSLEQARRATHVFPWSSRSWVALAEARLDAGDRGGALAAFRRAAVEDPGDWRPWLGIARTTDGATRRGALDRATRLNPIGLDIAQFRLRLARGEEP